MAAVSGVTEVEPRVWLVTDPDAVGRLLACPAAGTARVDRGDAETSWGPDGLATWMSVRRAMRPLLSASRVARGVPEMAERALRVIATWQGVIDPMRESVRLVSEVGAAYLLGESSPRLSASVGRELSLAGLPRLLRAPLRRAQRATYAAALRHGDAGTGLPVVLAEHGFDEHTRTLALRTMLLSGHHVPAAALAWALHELSAHPEVQDQVRAEAVARRSRVAGAVVREALRLHPPVWQLGRRLDAAVERFPQGATLLFSPYLNQRDARAFPDPGEFRPSRWHRASRPAPGSYFPFALGPRVCPGSQLALSMMTAIVTAVLTTHHLTPHRPPSASRGPLHYPRRARIGLRPVGAPTA